MQMARLKKQKLADYLDKLLTTTRKKSKRGILKFELTLNEKGEVDDTGLQHVKFELFMK